MHYRIIIFSTIAVTATISLNGMFHNGAISGQKLLRNHIDKKSFPESIAVNPTAAIICATRCDHLKTVQFFFSPTSPFVYLDINFQKLYNLALRRSIFFKNIARISTTFASDPLFMKRQSQNQCILFIVQQKWREQEQIKELHNAIDNISFGLIRKSLLNGSFIFGKCTTDGRDAFDHINILLTKTKKGSGASAKAQEIFDALICKRNQYFFIAIHSGDIETVKKMVATGAHGLIKNFNNLSALTVAQKKLQQAHPEEQLLYKNILRLIEKTIAEETVF